MSTTEIIRTCLISGKQFAISPAEQDYCKQNGIPLPVVHPHERLRHMLVFRNRLYLYHDKCALSQKPMLSCVPPESKYKVYDIDVWESDQWDGTEYGREYDFSRPFFEQFEDLVKTVPWPNLAIMKSLMENSDYTNGITSAKNCYLLFSSSFNEDCYFSSYLIHCKNIVDCTLTTYSELCYDCSNIDHCYNLYHSSQCFNCSDSKFLFECQSCSNCYGCVNLRNKKYCYYNRQLTEEEYKVKMNLIDLGSRITYTTESKKFEEFKKTQPIKYIFAKNIENSSGNNLFNTKNCLDCYFMNNTEDMESSIWVNDGKSSFIQAMFGNNSELIYNSVTAGDNAFNIKYSVETWPDCSDLEYCMYVNHGSSNCFGCIGLKRKNYCILNKQYSKEEYFEMVKRIKDHMRETGEYGQFFPSVLSPHYYNESESNVFFPLPKEEAIKLGYRWAEAREITEFVQTYQVPDNIKDVKDDILQTELLCEKTGKKYKIIGKELEFYRKHNLPIPRIASLARLEALSKALEVKEIKQQKCANCGVEIKTVYDPDKNTVYCDQCYLKVAY